jgi:hypothetical protein
MSKLRLVSFSGALVLAALIGGTIMSAVAAAPTATPAAEPAVRAPSAYCTTFRAAFAANLGVSQDEMIAAAKAAIGTAVDGAVSEGKLTADEGTRIKARVSAADADGCSILSGRRGVVARAALDVAQHGFAAAATALDMSPTELRAQMRGGATLKDVAAKQGVAYETVTAAVLVAVKADLAKAVAAGQLVQARADRILQRIERRLAAGWPRRAGRDGAAASAGGQ